MFRRDCCACMVTVVLSLFAATSVADSRLHLVIVTDDQEETIGHFCFHDGLNMRNVLYGNIDNRRLTWTHVAAENLFAHAERFTPRDVLNQIAAVPVAPEDALLVYYSGHGGYNDQEGHFFAVCGSETVLRRAAVVEAIRAKRPRLGVLITDCCYSFVPAQRYTPSVYQTRSDETAPLFDALFFRTSGLIDITSSEKGQVSACRQRPVGGSVFTAALIEGLKDARDQRRSWIEVFQNAKRATADAFRELYPEGLAIETPSGNLLQRTQTPFAFALPR